jgi:uncharacterized membrane protein
MRSVDSRPSWSARRLGLDITARRSLWLATTATTFVLSLFSILRHRNVFSDVYDFGLELQLLWNTSAGRWFESSLEVQNYLGDHTTFMTIPIALLYRLVPHPETVLIFQAAAYAAGAFPAHRIVLHLTRSPVVAALCALAYLAHPAGGYAVLYDFHTSSLCPVVALWCFAFALEGRWTATWVFFGLLLLIREDCGLTASGLGICLIGATRDWRRGTLMIVFGLAWFGLCLTVLIPFFRGAPSDTLFRYRYLGSSPGEILETITRHPSLVISHLFGDIRRLTYLPNLLAPWLLAGFASLSGLAAAGLVIAPSVLSNAIPQYTFGWHYPFTALPACLVAAALGWRNLLRGSTTVSRPLLLAWGAVVIGLNVNGMVIQDRWILPYNDFRQQVEQMRRLIPSDAALAVTSRVGAQFAERRYLALYPIVSWDPITFPRLGGRHAEYVLIDLEDTIVPASQLVPDAADYALAHSTARLRLYRRRVTAGVMP